MPQRKDDRWKCFSRYDHMWPNKQSGYISGVCETEQKDVLYIFSQERATPAYMQATSNIKCKKKKHRQIDEFNSLLFTYFTEQKKRILHSQLTSENPSHSVANE